MILYLYMLWNITSARTICCIHTQSQKLFFLWWGLLRFYSLSKFKTMQYSIIISSHYIVYYIPVTYFTTEHLYFLMFTVSTKFLHKIQRTWKISLIRCCTGIFDSPPIKLYQLEKDISDFWGNQFLLQSIQLSGINLLIKKYLKYFHKFYLSVTVNNTWNTLAHNPVLVQINIIPGWAETLFQWRRLFKNWEKEKVLFCITLNLCLTHVSPVS